jgi:GNAT superfamily N-acetyltransferase
VVSESTVDRPESLVVDGVRIGRYRLRDLPRTAELFAADVCAAQAADAVVASMAGWALTTTDAELIDRLLERGAVTSRRYALMSLVLSAAPSVAERRFSLQAAALTGETEVTPALIELIRSAYPEGHPDQEMGSADDIAGDLHRILAGEWLGPLHPVSRVLSDGGRPVAMIIVNRPPGRAPVGGLWLSEICRAPGPSYQGLGAELLLSVLDECRTSGEEALSLAVTDGNQARRLYERLGFLSVMSVTKVLLPR